MLSLLIFFRIYIPLIKISNSLYIGIYCEIINKNVYVVSVSKSSYRSFKKQNGENLLLFNLNCFI